MSADPAPAYTEDLILGGRVRLRQPANGARAAIDPVFLAAAVAPEPNHQVLEIGSGPGTAMLCLAARVPNCRIFGLELQRELVRLAGDNVLLNNMSARVVVMIGDLLRPPPRLSPGSFDHVMANPPYMPRGAATESPDPSKAASDIEGEAALADWVRFALTMAKAKGSITFIHRADRIDALIAQLAGRAGEIVVYPLWPKEGEPASRIIVRARKQIAAPARLARGMVLHEADGRFSAAAEEVLRAGHGIAL